MRPEHAAVAYRFAPIICHQTSGGPDERWQDYFCRIDFDDDRIADNNWDRLPDFKTRLVPEVYCSIVETRTHWILLYSVYHPRDWKSVGGHENDMEHCQVVVRKASGGVVEHVCTNAHHWQDVYYNPTAIDVSGIPKRDREMLYDGPITIHEGHPVIFIQQGFGTYLEMAAGQIGHGIQGVIDRPQSRWKPRRTAYEFSGGEGLVCTPDPAPHPPLDPALSFQTVTYSLIGTEQTLWEWTSEIGPGKLFSQAFGQWEADTFSYPRPRRPTRRQYFSDLGLVTEAAFPISFVGNEGVPNAAKAPFAYQLPIPVWAYLLAAGRDASWIAEQRRHNAHIDFGTKHLENAFDPAHSWSLRQGIPALRRFSTEYVFNPYVGI